MAATALRFGIPLAVVAIVVALRPEIATGTFSSAGSAVRVAVLIGAWIVFSRVVRRLIRNTAARTAVIAAAGAALLAVTVLPYFDEDEVDDAFPAAATPAVTTTVAGAQPAETAPATTVPAGPQKLASGQLRGLAGHRGSGEAALYRQPDGSLLVRLEDFNVSSVPAAVLYLVPGANRESPGGVNLGTLRGNSGNLNVPIPAGTDVAGTRTFLIWCDAFDVPVAAATFS